MYAYAIDPERTTLTFAVPGLLCTRGEFTRVAGIVTADERGIPQALEVTIAASSLRTGLAARDLHLRTAGFLGARRYPLIAYSAEHIEELGPGRYAVRGRLRLRGRDHPVTLEATLAPDDAPDGVRRARATADLPRTALAIPRNPLLRALLRPLIGDEVAITADVRGTRQRASAAAIPDPAHPAEPSRRPPSDLVS